ncbi:MAG: hypothetical protein WBW33_27265 [Bryobacteraceae bacterium]
MIVLFLVAGSLFASKKIISPTSSVGNDNVDITVTLTLAEPEVTEKLGVDAGPGIVLAEVRVANKTDHAIQVSPDDFILLAHDDGERYHAFTPNEIAGKGAMVLKTAPSRTGSIGAQPNSTVVAGIYIPRKSQPAKDSKDSKDGGDGSGQMDDKNAGNEKLLEALKAKQFKGGETTDSVEGYLYFPLDGKHKLKNMAVLYRGPAGRLDLEFEH